jgi:hypothetical protein
MEPGHDEHPVMEVTYMQRTKTESQKANGTLKIGALRLKRETLRELDAGELRQAQGGRPTFYCYTDHHCTRACPKTVGCGH